MTFHINTKKCACCSGFDRDRSSRRKQTGSCDTGAEKKFARQNRKIGQVSGVRTNLFLRIRPKNRTQFVEQRFVSVSDSNVGQVGFLDVVASDALLVEIGSDPMLFNLTGGGGEKNNFISIFNEVWQDVLRLLNS